MLGISNCEMFGLVTMLLWTVVFIASDSPLTRLVSVLCFATGCIVVLVG